MNIQYFIKRDAFRVASYYGEHDYLLELTAEAISTSLAQIGDDPGMRQLYADTVTETLVHTYDKAVPKLIKDALGK